MARPPKTYFSDAQTRKLVDEYTPYLSHLLVPAGGVRGVLKALLEHIDIPNLNREAAFQHLMAELLHDNQEFDRARDQADELSTEDVSYEDHVKAAQFIEGEHLESYGKQRVRKVLEEYSSHSVDSMRAESDGLLEAIKTFPFANATASQFRWLRERLPSLLTDLATKNACFAGCPKRTDVPTQEDLENLILPAGSKDNPVLAPVVLKDRILAHLHGLSETRVRDYLAGYRPKTTSRAQR